MADKTKCELALADYRAGGDRYDLLFSLRDCDIPDDILDSFFKARDGSGRKILLPLDAILNECGWNCTPKLTALYRGEERIDAVIVIDGGHRRQC